MQKDGSQSMKYIEPLWKFPVAIKWIFLRTFFLYGFRLLDRVCQKPHKKNLHKNLLFADHGEFPKRFISLILIFFSSAYATEYEPWFTPPFEFQGRASYLYQRIDKVDSPLGNFQAPSTISTLHLSLGMTPWPSWNVETQLLLARSRTISFSYEAALITLRYAWLDAINGDFLSLVPGLTLAFPGGRYLHSFDFFYHGHVNSELHITLGKEWSYNDEWIFRFWTLGGLGLANRGSPWLHGLAKLSCHLRPSLSLGLFSEALHGLGSQDLIPGLPFKGYASINHLTIDLGGFVDYEIRYVGTLSLLGWYNIYARNSIVHYWGAGLSLLFPFSIL